MRSMKFAVLVALLMGVSVNTVLAHSDQEALLKVKALYAAAAYEDALAVMAGVPADARLPELNQYLAFCLIALGDKQQAQGVIERLLTQNPMYELDGTDTSPRVIEAFREVRGRVLPAVTKKLYVDAKTSLERKDRAAAIERFETLLRVIGVQKSDETLEDMRVLAQGFLELSRALPPPPAPAPAVAAAPVTPADTGTTRMPVWTRPTAVKQEMPPWNAPDSLRRTEFKGVVRVRVGADGKVQSSEMVKSVHPLYDRVLMRAAQSWLYNPAQEDGKPVPSDILVEVQLKPQD
jgi:TonB family protein